MTSDQKQQWLRKTNVLREKLSVRASQDKDRDGIPRVG